MKEELKKEVLTDVIDEEVDVTVEAQEDIENEVEIAEIISMQEDDFYIEPDEDEIKNETAKFIELRRKKLAA